MQIHATISDNFKLLIKKGNYEKLIFELLKKSTRLFPNQYEHIATQSHGECDFIDLKTGEKYDAKLPITTKQGKWIGSNNSCFKNWIESMINECSEYTKKTIKQRDLQNNPEDLELYKILKNKIERDKADENIIFFFPYPVVKETSENIHGQFALDILSSIFDDLEKNGIVNGRKIYAIYPTIDNKICIRLLNTWVREWFPSDDLNYYIKYDFCYFVKKNNRTQTV